ncbi:MAG: LamG-like jellyroll fold domain-containing protein [Isosphaerales bacterium]
MEGLFTDVTVTFGTPITQSGADWSANVTVSSTSASLANGTGVSAQISGPGNSPGITGSYTLTNQPADQGAYQLTASQFDLTLSKLLTAHSSDITINYSPSAPAGQELVQIGSLSATLLPFNDTTATVDNLDIFDNRFSLDDSQSTPTATFDAKSLMLSSPDFPNAVGAITDFSATNAGFKIASATLTNSGDVKLGGILDFQNLSLGVQNFDYTTDPNGGAPSVTGTIGVTADSFTMFPGQTSFTTTVGGLNAGYDINSQVFALSATSFDLKAGKFFEANTTPAPTTTPTLSFTLDDSQSPPAVTFDAQNLTLTSTDFPNATGTLSNLHADNTGFSVGSVMLTDNGTLSLGGILSITGLSLGVKNFSYTTGSSGSAPTIGGTITFGATSVSLFSGQSEFTTTISDPSGTSSSGLSGSYDINTQALNFQLDQVDISVSDIFKITADAVAVDVAPGSFALSVGSATASVPRIAGLSGTVQKLTITNDGFNVGSAMLGATGTINVGKVISITGPSATITNLGYSISNGAQFNGDVNVAFDSASLNLSNAFQASMSGLSITIGLAAGDYGQFKVQADSASFQVGSYVTLKSKTFSINTAPGPMDDIASFQSVDATLSVGSLSFSGTGTNFAIDSSGNFVTLPGFSVSVDVSDPTSQLQWPSFLPIQVPKLALNWMDFQNDPTNFTIDLSASVNASLAGITLGGFVQDAVIDINKLKQGQFPVTSIGGAGISAGGTFVGVQLKAEAFLATATVNDQYGQPENVLYGGIDGGIEIAGLGGVELRLGLSQNGPLDASVRADAPIIVDPETGLALTGLRGGIKFDDTLTTPDSAKDLSKLVHQQFGDLTLDEWKTELAGQVATQAATGGSWTNLGTNFVINAGATLFDAYASTYAFQLNGDIAFDTTGKILASGDVTLGNTVKVQGSVFLDLSQVASGKATIMINVTAPADYPIVTAYGSLNFEFDGPVLSPVQVPSGSSTPQLGTGLVLDGATGYGSASNINLNNSSYTVEFWAQRKTTGQQEYVIAQAPPSSTTGLSIGFDTNNNFVVNSGGSTLSFPAGVDTSWHHWAVTFDATTGTRTIYRDGISETSDTAKAIQNASTTLWIGKSGPNFYAGGVDEVRVWTVARAAADIQSNLALVTLTATTGLLADWSFSEGTGTAAADSSGKGDTLTLSGGATWGPTTIAGAAKLSSGATTPQLGSGLMLNGTDAYASATGINLNNTSFSVEFWAKQNDTGRLEYIINQGDPPSAGGLQVGFDAGNNFFVSFGGSTLKTPTNDNNWHHWAVTFDLKTGQRVIYMDGKPAVSDTAQPLTGASTTFLIGKSGSFYFDGNVDEVRVWTVERMETDIQNRQGLTWWSPAAADSRWIIPSR